MISMHFICHQIREIGVKLYLLWLQDLQENIDELGLLVYGSIIPGFPNPLEGIDRSKIYRPQRFIDSVYPCISGSGYVTMTTSSSQYLSYLDIDSGRRSTSFMHRVFHSAHCATGFRVHSHAIFANVPYGAL